MPIDCLILSQSLCSGSNTIGCPDSYSAGPLFFGPQDQNYLQCINAELIKNISGQWLMYYRIDPKRTVANIYGESKDKWFYPPVKIWARCEYHSPEQTVTNFTLDENRKLSVYFNKFMLQKINLKPTVGDMISYGDTYYEIDTLISDQPVFGIIDSQIEIKAECHRTRGTQFSVK